MAANVKNLRSYIQAGLNVLLEGAHGTGKTSMILAACEAEGLTCKIFNAATIDVYTDLTGVPVPETDAQGNKYLQFVRPHDVDGAEVIFIDELNRAMDPKTTNAFLELVQFHSINGEKIPHLKSIMAAQNPASADLYDVAPLDPALVDRFHLVIPVEPTVSVAYLATRFPRPVAEALAAWHNGHNRAKTEYISPRRVEMLGEVFMKLKNKSALVDAMPPGGDYDTTKLWKLLSEAALTPAERDAREAARTAQLSALAAVRGEKPALSTAAARLLNDLPSLAADPQGSSAIRRRTPSTVAAALAHAGPAERKTIVEAISTQIRVNNIVDLWAPAYALLTEEEVKAMVKRWSANKRSALRHVMAGLPAGTIAQRGLGTLSSAL